MRNTRRIGAILTVVGFMLGVWMTAALADRNRARLLPSVQESKPAATDAKPQAPPPAPDQAKKGPVDYSKFKHEDHDGEVRKLTGAGTMKLDCNYCHLVDPKEKYASGFGEFPCENPETAKKIAGTKRVLHSACMECHRPQFLGAGAKREMCLICHTQFGFKPNLPVRPFPNQQSASEFSLNFPHRSHRKKVTFAQAETDQPVEIASASPVLPAHSPVKQAQAATFACTACHNVQAEGVYVSKPQHRECFVCHMEQVDARYKDVQSEPHANDCAGCHPKAKSNPFKDLPRETGFVLANAKDKDGRTLFRHDSDHAILTQMPGTDKTVTCLMCHGRVSNEPARSKLKTDKARREFLVAPYPDACAGCHTFKRKALVGYVSSKKKFGNIFTVSNCDQCHAQDIIDRDADYHKKQEKALQTPPAQK